MKSTRLFGPCSAAAIVVAGTLAGCSGSKDVQVADAAGAAEAVRSAIDLTRSLVDVDAPRPQDERTLKALTLDNGLQVLLVSDPRMQKSAAAMDVAVGSLEDPWDRLGTAHFLEHLLFLGTEKYPDVESYNEYISSNGGSSNAYTAATRTNYQLEINHDALEEGLDRFAQFFISPLFDKNFVEREMNAVNSEHEKNLQDDFWRGRMVRRANHADGHPRQKFSTGDLSTLSESTREELIEFYQKFYSANVMRLCILGNQDIDTLEKWAREKYTAIPNHNRGELTYSGEVYDLEKLPLMIEIKPVTDMRQLQLQFPAPPNYAHYKAKPTRLIGTLIGHEGEGSLLSQLKKEGLATGLFSGRQSETWATYLGATVVLTDKGRQEVDRVIELFFSYVETIKRDGLQDYHYLDEKMIAELGYYFRDHEEGMWAASGYAAAMQQYPALEFEKNQHLYTEFDPDLFQQFLAAITPEKMYATLTAPDVETDIIEPHYGTEYTVYTIPNARLSRWQQAEPMAAFHSPEPNPFVPANLDLLSNAQAGPYKLVDDERGVFWFEQDRRFKLPKATLDLTFLTNEVNRTPRNRLLGNLYAQAINEGLNEWKYPAIEAGLNAVVSANSRGIKVSVTGYSDKLPNLLEEFSKQLNRIQIDQETFEAIKAETAREFANNDFSQAYSQSFYELNVLIDPHAIHRNEYRDMVESVTLDELKGFAATVLNEVAIEGAAYGNLDPANLKASVDHAFENVAKAVLPSENHPAWERINMAGAGPKARVFSSKTDNNCWIARVQFGQRDYRTEAILRIGAAYLKPGFYGEMRTKQQLGYIVASGASLDGPDQAMWFLIQSGTYVASEISERAQAWLAANIPARSEMTEEEFAELRGSILDQLKQEETDMGERLGTMLLEGTRLDGDFSRRQHIIAEVEKLTKADVAAAYAKAFKENEQACLVVYLDADGKEATAPAETQIADTSKFKEMLPTF